MIVPDDFIDNRWRIGNGFEKCVADRLTKPKTTPSHSADSLDSLDSMEPGCVWQHPMDPCCNFIHMAGHLLGTLRRPAKSGSPDWITDHHSPQPSDWETKSLGIVPALCLRHCRRFCRRLLRCSRLSHISRLFNGNLLLESPQYSGQLGGVCI